MIRRFTIGGYRGLDFTGKGLL